MLLANALAFALQALLNASAKAPVVSYSLGPLALLFLLTGTAIGLCQRHVLKEHFKQAYWWIVVTAVGEMLTELMQNATSFYTFMLFPESPRAFFWLYPLITALLPGAAQYFFFEGRVKRAWLWVPFSLLADSCLPGVAGIPGTYNGLVVSLEAGIGLALIQIVFGGAILGGITGIPLVGFIAQKNKQDSATLL